ncbi:MAG: hypothetical protein LUH02_09735, partial [Erysipelotrichaceae bacterium]|nr:hypothetical protein [Erysipelotrichaceae bacterium]
MAVHTLRLKLKVNSEISYNLEKRFNCVNRGKKTERKEEAQEIVQKDGTVKMVHKFKKKRRFGSS